MTRDALADYVRGALVAGRGRERIDADMAEAGWPARDRARALAGWHDAAGGPPVPRPRPGFDLAGFLLSLFRYGALAILVGNAIEMAHALIAVGLPEGDALEAEASFDRALNAFRWAVASGVVIGPLWIWLAIRDARAVRAEPALRAAPARRAPALTVMAIAAATFLWVLVSIVYGFLTGDGTLQAFLRSLAVIAGAGLVFALTRRDLTER